MSTSPMHTLAKVPSGGALADALAESLAGVSFADTTFYAFTRRRQSGRVDRPRPVRANSRILKSSSTYFRGHAVLSGTARASAPPSSTDNYAFEEDSDIEDEEDDTGSFGSLLATPSEVSLQDDIKEKHPDTVPNDSSGGTTTVAPTDDTRIVPLDTVAADTLEALIFYIYTGNVYFLPLRSRGAKAREEAKAVHNAAHPNRPMCSCKSMYRFASEAGLDELKEQAEAHLFAQLDAENVLDELFSRFSARYPAILRRQISLLLREHWTAETKAALAPKVQSIVRGELRHAAPVLTMLLGEIPATVPAPLKASSAPAPSAKPPRPASVASDAAPPSKSSGAKAVPASAKAESASPAPKAPKKPSAEPESEAKPSATKVAQPGAKGDGKS